jgi:hypothetical protein
MATKSIEHSNSFFISFLLKELSKINQFYK